ncbi:Uncharacterised protein [Vibrio cholerae]|nr:Uncharacterised protein [Vibrio cholerae]
MIKRSASSSRSRRSKSSASAPELKTKVTEASA